MTKARGWCGSWVFDPGLIGLARDHPDSDRTMGHPLAGQTLLPRGRKRREGDVLAHQAAHAVEPHDDATAVRKRRLP
jgi:hypothetical protein